MDGEFDVRHWRNRFPALGLRVGKQAAVFFDGPAGSQVPQQVVDAMSAYLVEANANGGGLFDTSRRSDAWMSEAHAAVADLLGTRDPELVVFGPNMTTLTLSLARALGRTWGPEDEVLVTRLEHDANFTPWVQAARDAGARVRYAAIRTEDCTLDLEDLRSKLSERTRLVAVGAASNAAGTVNPVRQIAAWAHEVGANVFVDAVHYAPHLPIDVEQWNVDFLACSAYKFFGPHVGILWGRRELMAELPVYKLRPASDELPGRWETGTQNHEGLAGTMAAIEYLAEIGRKTDPAVRDRRGALLAAYTAIEAYERKLARRMIDGLGRLPGVHIRGITEARRLNERVPTVSFTCSRKAVEVAGHLAEHGVFVWHGNFYALPLTEALGLEPDGMVRIGLLHYNEADEIDRMLEVLRSIL